MFCTFTAVGLFRKWA